MMPELGKYAVTVLSAYGASLLLLAVLVGATLRRGRRMRAEMAKTEERLARDG
ncbi:heme exporter protein CcmD [Seohaeicola nanhaiensis]|uniref:Heme exporter protein D n=1 Tax=Seohaeicola nanhaiensis TaxID=1387282 RepID=A0ABV9KK25_9RHOB